MPPKFEMATRDQYLHVLVILAELEFLHVPVEHCVGLGQPVIANESLILVALLNKRTSNGFSILNENMTASNSSSVMVAGGILQYLNFTDEILFADLTNWRSVGGLLSPIASFVVLFSAFGFHFETSFVAVFEFVVGIDKLLEIVADKLLVTVVDRLQVFNRLEFDILVVDRFVTVSLAGAANNDNGHD
ncbi:hypothetical protein G9A89_011230 [Geosiphon pyriformis]|nr:hypothetical protein G9A89_011230 [Geosiphon pyriformis]